MQMHEGLKLVCSRKNVFHFSRKETSVSGSELPN